MLKVPAGVSESARSMLLVMPQEARHLRLNRARRLHRRRSFKERRPLLDELFQALSQSRDISSWVEPTVDSVSDALAHRTHISGDHRDACGEGLTDHKGRVLRPLRWHDDDINFTEDLRQVLIYEWTKPLCTQLLSALATSICIGAITRATMYVQGRSIESV